MTHYVTVHNRLRSEKGSASLHACVSCGSPAEQWAYQYTGDPELVYGEFTLYSDNLDCYAPMCRPCHRKFDLENDPRLRGSLRDQGATLGAITGSRKANTTRRSCSVCGLTAHPGALGAHQSSTGHTGYETVPDGH